MMRQINEVNEISFEDYVKQSNFALDTIVLADTETLLSLLMALPEDAYIETIIQSIANYPSADLKDKAAIVSKASSLERKDLEKHLHRTKEINGILKRITEVKIG